MGKDGWLALGLAWLVTGCQLIADIDEARTPAEESPAGDGDGDGDGAPDAGGGGMVDAGSGGPSQACRDYCATVMAACSGVYQVYTTETNCLAVCALIPEGDPSSPAGNTVACRVRQAGLASDTKEFWDHCAAAGPGGGNICGDNCESYCALFERACPDDVVPDCEQRCDALRDLDEEPEGDDFRQSTYDVMAHHDGEFLQCRLVHVASAAQAPGLGGHCWHSTVAPRPQDGLRNPCTYPSGTEPRCQDYCRLNLSACTGDNAQYEDMAQCLAACEPIPPGDGNDQNGVDSVGCRIAHSYNAQEGPETHCPHAGPTGAAPCGDRCDSYCRTLEAACKTEYDAAFADQAACTSACQALPGADASYTVKVGEAGGDTYGCRMLHAARGFADPTACGAALGGAPCSD